MTHPAKISSQINQAYRRAHRRLLLLDYDGTLRPIAPTPSEAVPSAQLRTLLRALAKDPQNIIVVVSGRPRITLDEWLGDIPIGVTAEHGFFTRSKDGPWQANDTTEPVWKITVRPLLEAAAHAAPGSFVEEKERALVWHYRLADQELAANLAADLPAAIMSINAANIDILPGKKIFEVLQAGHGKDAAAREWQLTDTFDFVLAAGDDHTDESLFRATQEGAYTVKVGSGETSAQHRVGSPQELLDLLTAFLD